MAEIFSEKEAMSQNSDRALLGACAGLEAVNRELHALFANAAEARSETALARNNAAWEQLAIRAAALRATSLAGIRARVRAIGTDFVAEVLRSADSADGAERAMIEALIRDLIPEE